ncbi:hypothetical protein llap_13591 [Limosa lapponica baueri]|uniref:Uncharacterized protein n=1 Tax=Limosa lapponica baueri TaxID=1758121 RepID=A0A2I0TQN6_LIMLA|nr:hypothetical protein llap_13591 [Limosa lapponica baueri]
MTTKWVTIEILTAYRTFLQLETKIADSLLLFLLCNSLLIPLQEKKKKKKKKKGKKKKRKSQQTKRKKKKKKKKKKKINRINHLTQSRHSHNTTMYVVGDEHQKDRACSKQEILLWEDTSYKSSAEKVIFGALCDLPSTSDVYYNPYCERD